MMEMIGTPQERTIFLKPMLEPVAIGDRMVMLR
jgi:hypothetical protein